MDIPADDAPVDAGVTIYRLVKTTQCSPRGDQWAFQSGAFDNNDGDDMSVVLGDTLRALDRGPDDLPERLFPDEPDEWGVAALPAEALLDEEQELRRTPTEQERAHGDARGKKGSSRRKRLKRRAEWIRQPRAAPN